jgi:predicted MFS family arabinose efflux permease
MNAAQDYSEFRQGWRVVLASLVGIGLGLSPVPFYTIGMLAPELARTFHWPFGKIMGGLTITSLTVLIASPLVGLLADRFGVRRVALTSIVLFGCSFAAFSLTQGSLPLFYLTWGAVALGGAGTLPITWTRAVNNWFDVRKGLALGLSLLGTGLFGFFIKPICAWLIAHEGWRTAYLVIGAMPVCISLPIAWLFFHDVGERTPRTEKSMVPGLSFVEALRDWRFWVLAVAFVPISFAVGGPIPNMENILATHGFDKATIATLVPFIGLSVIAGRIIGGWLIDRAWAPGVAFVLLSLPAIGCWLLAHGPIDYRTALFCIALIGFAAGVEYDLMAFLVARYFGMRSYATIYGSLYGCFALGAGVGPLLFGNAFDKTHSYSHMLVISCVILVAAALMLLSLGRYRRFAPPGTGDLSSLGEAGAPGDVGAPDQPSQPGVLASSITR